AAVGLAAGALLGVDALPVLPADELGDRPGQGLLGGRGGAVGVGGGVVAGGVGEHAVDRLDGVGPVGADDAAGAPLGPAHHVGVRHHAAGLVDHAALDVGHDAAAAVERQARQR